MLRYPERKDVPAKRLAEMENPSDAQVYVLIDEELCRWKAKLTPLNHFLEAELTDRQTSAWEKKAAEKRDRLLQQEKESKRLDSELEAQRKTLEKANRERAAALLSQAHQDVPSSGPPSGGAPQALISGPPSGPSSTALPLPVHPVPPNSGAPSAAPSGGGNLPSSAGQLGAWQHTPIPFSQGSGGYVSFAIFDFISQH
jgi:hypothetical protein